jgi:hypothetical protein
MLSSKNYPVSEEKYMGWYFIQILYLDVGKRFLSDKQSQEWKFESSERYIIRNSIEGDEAKGVC